MYVMRGRMPIRSMTWYMHPWWLRWGVRMVGRWMIPAVPFKEAYFYEDALRFREALKLPLVYVGGLISREKIDMVLDSGFEFVAMARALLNTPDFVNRMKPVKSVVIAVTRTIALPGCIRERWPVTNT